MNSLTQFHAGHECLACGGHFVKELWTSEDFVYGAGKDEITLTVNVPELHCDSCEMVYTDHRAEVIRHEAVCRHLKISSPREIVSIREKAGLTQKEFSEISKIGRASLSRWETGEGFQNGSIDNFVYLLGFEENIERLKNRFVENERKEPPKSPRTPCVRRFRCLTPEQLGSLNKQSQRFSLFAAAA